MRKSTITFMLLSAAMIGCPPAGQVPGAGPAGGPAGGPGAGGGTAGGEGGMQLSNQCTGNWGTGQAAQKVGAFFGATSDVLLAVSDIQSQLLTTCKTMGGDLGLSPVELTGDAHTVCGNVANRLRTEMGDLRAQARLNIQVVSTPPKCEVSVDAYAKCAAECDATVQPGQVNIQCEGGYIAGECDARCTGECQVDVQGRCGGECDGQCGGSCSGTCNGYCDGHCSHMNAQGQCDGRCSGTCQGSCSAGCQGSCQGECWVKGKANCHGTCRGGCSVAYKAPYCTGQVKPPKVSASCNASCNAKFDAQAKCTPGHTEVHVNGAVASNLQEKLQNIRAALRDGYGGILALRLKAQRLQMAANELHAAANNLQGVGRQLGGAVIRYGACMSDAGRALLTAAGQFGVSVQVSVEVSASVSASAG